MSSIAVIFEAAVNCLRFCNKCCKEDEKEEKKKSVKKVVDDGTDEENSEAESEEGTDSEKKDESEPMTKNKKKTEKKRRNGYKAVDREPTITTQPQPLPVPLKIENHMNPTFTIYNNSTSALQPGMPSAIPGPSVSPGPSPGAGSTEQSIVKWVSSTIETAVELLDTAVVGGYDIDDSDLWIIRANLKCEIIPGKLNQYHNLAFVLHKVDGTYAERNVEKFQVLCVEPEFIDRIRWTKCSDGVVPGNAVEGGRKCTGEVLYIGRQIQNDETYPRRHSLCPGMIQPSHKVLYVTYDFKVYAHKFYEVLCID